MQKSFMPTRANIHDGHPDFKDAQLTYDGVRARLQSMGWDFIQEPLYWSSGEDKDQYTYLVNDHPHMPEPIVMNLHGYHDLEGVDAWLRGRGK